MNPLDAAADLQRLPGASTYRVANKIITAKRKALHLIDPFEISFERWGPGNKLYDWYMGRQNRYIQAMNLRKERKRPFYHEFIVFRLRDGTFWRIDRRQLPNEPVPINCIHPQGVKAYDTIEQVTGMESLLDPLLSTGSDCMVELEFKKDVDVGLVLRICRAIQAHDHARNYTLQRYNCFFFAQALVMCTACGVSDWAGWGEPGDAGAQQDGPWKSPNVRLDENGSELNNATLLVEFDWNPSQNFKYDWDALSQQSNPLINSSPLLRHADHCNYCLESQTLTRQRSLSREINRLKQGLVEYWNKEYRRLLNDAYRMNHEKFVTSGVWGIIKQNTSEQDCKQMLPDKLGHIGERWEKYAEKRLKELLATADDLLDPAEICDAWYPDPDEWKSTWTCKDGGPVKAAMERWKSDVKDFVTNEFANLKDMLEAQTIQSSTQLHENAMRTRMESFEQAITIRLRDMDENEYIKPMQPEDANPLDGVDPSKRAGPSERVHSPEQTLKPDHLSVFSGKTRKSIGTFFSSRASKMTKRATQIKNRMRRLFKGSHQLEPADVMQMERRIRVFITKHGNNVELYKPLLKCTSDEVQEDMRRGIDEVWDRVIR